MNKKQKTYTLLILVIGIWGLIGYNIYTYLNPKIEKHIPVSQKINANKFTPVKKDTLVITNYRDPFLGKIITHHKKTKNDAQITKSFPSIIYHGLVKGNSIKSYIISVQNRQEMVEIGQTFLNVKLISANDREITILHKNSRKTIKIQD